MKCLISVIATLIVCSITYAVDESSLPGATIIELDKMTPNVKTLANTTKVEQPAPKAKEEKAEKEKKPKEPKEKKHTVVTMLKCDGKNTLYTVQLGAFKARERAFALYWQMSKKVSKLQVTAPLPKDQLYRVRYGSYQNREEAKAAAEMLRKKGIECFVTPLKTMEIIPLKKGE